MTRFERSLASVDKADDCQATIACSFWHKREIFAAAPELVITTLGKQQDVALISVLATAQRGNLALSESEWHTASAVTAPTTVGSSS
jgi:hypothetical protein